LMVLIQAGRKRAISKIIFMYHSVTMQSGSGC
jgi:hypothetical protein